MAPPVEETVKYLGVVVIYLLARNEIDDLFDGFIYGAMVGLGFAAVENIQYFVQAIAATGGGDQIGPVFEMFLLRVVIVGAYMHVLWTGISGVGLAYYVTQRDQPHSKRLLYAVGLFVLAVVAHFLWNSPLLTDLIGLGLPGQVAFGLIKGSPFFIFLALLVFLAQRREHRWFGAAVEGELGSDIISHDELAQLGGLRSRRAARKAVAQKKGSAGERLMGRLQREQINLAMIRTRVQRPDHPDLDAQREQIRRTRAELAALSDLGAQPVAFQQAPALQQPPVPGVTGWRATHFVPPPGMAAWDAPDPTRQPIVMLSPGVQLQVVEQLGAWARVVAANGWQAWVDGRLLGIMR